MRPVLLGYAACTVCLCGCSTPESSDSTVGPGIYQLRQIRDARDSCWGIAVVFDTLTLKADLAPGEVGLVDGKRARDHLPSMNCTVEKGGKRLVIDFKPGLGGFGSGNHVDVWIERSAFREPPTIPGRLEFRVPTDLF